jgi:hypothetical protein
MHRYNLVSSRILKNPLYPVIRGSPSVDGDDEESCKSVYFEMEVPLSRRRDRNDSVFKPLPAFS